jgi:hypothetical protein
MLGKIMTYHDILNALDDTESDADLATAVAMGTRTLNDIRQERLPDVALAMALTVSGFRMIPETLLTKDVLIAGMRHMNARQAEIHATEDYKENYRLAALTRLEKGELFLSSFNHDLIDKRMLLQTMATSSIGDTKAIVKAKESVIDDEVAIASLDKGYAKEFFLHSAASKFTKETWVAALAKDDFFFEILASIEHERILQDVISDGHWSQSRLGKKPGEIKDTISERIKVKDASSSRAMALTALIRTYPFEETLPLLKTSARAAVRSKIYTSDELRPYMKQFPFLKADVLESDLGM